MESNWKELTNLIPDSRVKIWVSAATSIGEGQATPRKTATLAAVSAYSPVAVGGDRQLRIGAGGGLTLGCRGLGSPSPEITWLRNGAGVSRDNLHQPLPGGDLHITGKIKLIFSLKTYYFDY